MLRVLLVDDEMSDLDLLREAFAHRGAQVTAAATDKQAYDCLAAARDAPFDLLVTDINLGRGTTGFDVARAARARQPGLPVVYITAYDVSTQAHAVANSLFLRKPIRLAELADRALDLLATQPSGYGPDQEQSRKA